MGVRFRYVLAVLLLLGLFGSLAYRHAWLQLETRYREAVEENLVDQSELLAALLSNGLPLDSLPRAFAHLQQRDLHARIYSFTKEAFAFRIYVTDSTGKLLYHSQAATRSPAQPAQPTPASLRTDSRTPTPPLGADYSQWRDVALTLRGEYGARSTRDDPADEASSVLYVAAPILRNGHINGVVTIGKPARDFGFFIVEARRQLGWWFASVGGAVLLLGLVGGLWVLSPVSSLRRYARQLLGSRAQSDTTADPSTPNRAATSRRPASHDTAEVRDALASLSSSLEAKSYVEQYVQVLTHELKSPLSAIQGAAEILEGELATADRHRFLENIHQETRRLRELVDAILRVSSLERQEHLEQTEPCDLSELLREAARGVEIQAHAKQVTLENHCTQPIPIAGNRLLLRQALHNLLLNAVEHSPTGGTVELTQGFATRSDTPFLRTPNNSSPASTPHPWIRVTDLGSGIPDFALARLGQKFYSLPKPDTGRKGTGLGLTLVREVARLHGATFELCNRATFEHANRSDAPLANRTDSDLALQVDAEPTSADLDSRPTEIPNGPVTGAVATLTL
jgi:two-component system sensor histidine kinase CreC